MRAYTVEFIHGDGTRRPTDLEHRVEGEDTLPCLPDVGDTINYKIMDSDQFVARKVLSRHFYTYDSAKVHVSIVVGEVSDKEMMGRAKE